MHCPAFVWGKQDYRVNRMCGQLAMAHLYMIRIMLSTTQALPLQVPYYNVVVNVIWAGLLSGITTMTGLLMMLEFVPVTKLASPTFTLNIFWVSMLATVVSTLQKDSSKMQTNNQLSSANKRVGVVKNGHSQLSCAR